MIKKNNERNGVSLVVLLITIAVFLVLLTAITFSADNVINNTKKKQFAKEIYEVQNLVDRYKYENEEYPYIVLDGGSYEIIEIEVTDTMKAQFSNETFNSDGTLVLYIVNLSEIGVENITRGTKEENNEKDVYAFSKDTGKVYYIKGYKVGKSIYYTLTNELRKLVGLKEI